MRKHEHKTPPLVHLPLHGRWFRCTTGIRPSTSWERPIAGQPSSAADHASLPTNNGMRYYGTGRRMATEGRRKWKRETGPEAIQALHQSYRRSRRGGGVTYNPTGHLGPVGTWSLRVSLPSFPSHFPIAILTPSKVPSRQNMVQNRLG